MTNSELPISDTTVSSNALKLATKSSAELVEIPVSGIQIEQQQEVMVTQNPTPQVPITKTELNNSLVASNRKKILKFSALVVSAFILLTGVYAAYWNQAQQTKTAKQKSLIGKIDTDKPNANKSNVTGSPTTLPVGADKLHPVAPTNSTSPKPLPPTTTHAPAQAVSAIPKRFVSTTSRAALAQATTVTQAEAALQSFATQYGLTMEIGTVSASDSAKIYDTYTIVKEANLTALKTYGDLFIDEWAKYPVDWVAASKLKNIALVTNFAVSGTNRAAAPDPSGLTMYYDVTYSGLYAREVLHHEYNHLFTYTETGSYAPSDPAWTSYNTAGFVYGNGGASCYAPNNSCLTGAHPIPGFVSGYASSAIEEDKAETYAYLMTSDYYHNVKTWIASDQNLSKKVSFYKTYVAARSSSMGANYFDYINP